MSVLILTDRATGQAAQMPIGSKLFDDAMAILAKNHPKLDRDGLIELMQSGMTLTTAGFLYDIK